MLRSFIEALANRKSSDIVFNQYLNPDIRNNLELYFNYLLNNKHSVLMLGEAPGYKGCKLTGIPFTSGNIIINSQHKIFKDIGSKIKLSHIVSENTATIFWSFLDKTFAAPILWNAFPFHPHKQGIQDSNRKPNKIEIEEGKLYLHMVYELFHPNKLFAIGRTGEAALKDLFPNHDIKYIRHPSRGGKREFIKAIKTISE